MKQPYSTTTTGNESRSPSLRLAVIGDLMLCSKLGASHPDRGLEALSADVRTMLENSDVVFGNLECTLPGPELVPTEPRVISTEEQIRSIEDTGIDVVTLGNNHMFDCLDAGFERTTALLDRMKIGWCGAGRNLKAALRPAIIEKGGIRLAFVGMVGETTGASRFATPSQSGVAPLETRAICRLVESLQQDVDHVVVSPHWGEERFRFPSPVQVRQAHAFIDAGASMVVGHHPHVLQGMETYRDRPIIYSLGNFIANNVHWTSTDDVLTWSRFERTSCIMTVTLSKGDVIAFEQTPTYDDRHTVCIDRTGWGRRCIDQANRFLRKGITASRYRRERIRVQKIRPFLDHLRWSNLRKIRPHHLRRGMKLLVKG